MRRFTVVAVSVLVCGLGGATVALGQGVPAVPPQQPYGMGPYGDMSQPGSQMDTAVVRPGAVAIDVNEIAAELKKFPALEAPLKAVDANSEIEQRAWVLRRTDNRTQMLRLVQKQFEDEMAFAKRVALEEKAAKTTKAVEDLVAARKKRYELISQELRDQRRQALLESRGSTAGTRGRGTSGRGSRGRSSTSGGLTGQDPYGTSTQARAPRRPVAEVNEPPIDPNTQEQIDAWLNANPENKAELLRAVHERDIIEYSALDKVAEEEKAAKTGAAVMGLLLLREGRIETIEQRWVEEDERMQRLQERTGGMDTTQPGGQQGMRRGRR